jgi:hypothetical protein
MWVVKDDPLPNELIGGSYAPKGYYCWRQAQKGVLQLKVE